MQLCLGTVQFGMQYGIASSGRPGKEDVFEIINHALKNDITTLDTAGGYGDAQTILGEFMACADRKKLNIITKILPNALNEVHENNYYATLKQNISDSLKQLNTDYVDSLLFHNAQYVNDEAALYALNKLKIDGFTKNTGISIYTPSEFEKAACSEYVDIIQIPYNILDTRLDKILLGCTKEIHARSAFLQGLLLMEEANIPNNLVTARPYIKKFADFCKKENLTRTQAALGFVKTQTKIEKIVFGVDNLTQLKQIIYDFNSDTPALLLKELASEFTGIEEKIIMPPLWNS